MLRKILAPALAFAVATGCAASGRVHDKNYVRAVAISGSERIRLSLEFFDGEEPLTAEGRDIAEALENAELKSGKPAFTGYTELAILGDCDYEETLKLLLNDWKISPDCVVVYSEDGEGLLAEAGAELSEGRAREAVKKGLAPESDVAAALGELLQSGEAEAPAMDASGVKGTKLLTR